MADDTTPNLIFIHGSGATRRVWRYQTSAFPGSIALDLPGHPSGQGLNTISGYCVFVIRTIRERRLYPTILVGHSMGGAITIEIALNHPQLLAGIVLVSSGARLRVTPVIKDEILRDYPHAAEIIAEWAHSPKSDLKFKRAAVQELLEVPAAVTYGDFEACDNFDRMKDIGQISLPTLIICGKDDRLTPIKYSKYMQERIRTARFVAIADAGHSVMLEKPEELNAAIGSFISDLSMHSI